MKKRERERRCAAGARKKRRRACDLLKRERLYRYAREKVFHGLRAYSSGAPKGSCTRAKGETTTEGGHTHKYTRHALSLTFFFSFTARE